MTKELMTLTTQTIANAVSEETTLYFCTRYRTIH